VRLEKFPAKEKKNAMEIRPHPILVSGIEIPTLGIRIPKLD